MTMEFIAERDRIYANDESGNVVAEITFPTHESVSTIDHTYVDISLRGQGIAEKLMRLAVDKIMADGNKIAATCPYAAVWLRRHPEYEVAECCSPIMCRIGRKY